eukprot:scaffold2948_cov296-Prasinococcus_capsulatus_cf.AAC.1
MPLGWMDLPICRRARYFLCNVSVSGNASAASAIDERELRKLRELAHFVHLWGLMPREITQ